MRTSVALDSSLNFSPSAPSPFHLDVSLTNLSDEFHKFIVPTASQAQRMTNGNLRQSWVASFMTQLHPQIYENYRHGGANY